MYEPIASLERGQDFPDTPEVSRQLDVVNVKYIELNSERQKLDMLVRALQSGCWHQETEPVMQYDPNYRLAHANCRGMEVYIGSKCIKCKLFIPRKPGSPSEVCHKCGGDMESDGVTPGRGARLHWHVCRSCGHEVAYT